MCTNVTYYLFWGKNLLISPIALDSEKMYISCMDNSTAYLSNEGRYTIFAYGGETIKMISPYSLERYDNVVTWDNGYIVVMTKYSHSKELIEEYIDLIPVLNDLYIDSKKFLTPIKKVEVKRD